MDELKKWIPSAGTRWLIGCLGALLLALLIFHAGLVAGSRRFGEHLGDFGFRPAPGFSEVRLPHGFIPNGHGAVGTVQSVTASVVVLQMRDGSAQTLHLSTTTVIRNDFGDASSTSLAAGERVIVLGSPRSDGSLSADLIRIVAGIPATRNTIRK